MTDEQTEEEATPEPTRSAFLEFRDEGGMAQMALLSSMADRWFDVTKNMPGAVAKLTKEWERDGQKKSMTLDYVGHADITRILTLEDPLWDWRPLAFEENGTPVMDRTPQGKPIGLWIRLTMFGVTRLGYGSCEASKTDPVKELIGDALRNAAMRFGIALKLWSKAEWDGSPEGRVEDVQHHAPGTSFEELLTPGQLQWRARGWPASTDAEAMDHKVQVDALKARITAMPADVQERIREFRNRLNSGAWPPIPAHFDAIAQYLDGLDDRATREATGSEPQEAPAEAGAVPDSAATPEGATAQAEQPETGTSEHEAVKAYVEGLETETVTQLMKLRGIKPLRGATDEEKRALLLARLITEGWRVPVAGENPEGGES